jgi:tetratricopeptide (TPR) repeat protein
MIVVRGAGHPPRLGQGARRAERGPSPPCHRRAAPLSGSPAGPHPRSPPRCSVSLMLVSRVSGGWELAGERSGASLLTCAAVALGNHTSRCRHGQGRPARHCRPRLRQQQPACSSDNGRAWTWIGRARFRIALFLLVAVVAAPGDAWAQGFDTSARATRPPSAATTTAPSASTPWRSSRRPAPSQQLLRLQQRANAYAAKRDWEHALQDYSEALKRNPKFAAARRNRGLVYARTGDHERAIQDFTEAAQLDADDPHALIYRGLVYCDRREFDPRGPGFRRCPRDLPTCPYALSGRAAAAARRDCR